MQRIDQVYAHLGGPLSKQLLYALLAKSRVATRGAPAAVDGRQGAKGEGREPTMRELCGGVDSHLMDGLLREGC